MVYIVIIILIITIFLLLLTEFNLRGSLLTEFNLRGSLLTEFNNARFVRRIWIMIQFRHIIRQLEKSIFPSQFNYFHNWVFQTANCLQIRRNFINVFFHYLLSHAINTLALFPTQRILHLRPVVELG